jgi:hypothetical protein
MFLWIEYYCNRQFGSSQVGETTGANPLQWQSLKRNNRVRIEHLS